MTTPGDERFLTAVDQRAKPRGQFLDRVRDRLAKGAVEYGDTALDRTLVELLEEMLEECADIPGWGAKADQVARLAGIPEPRRSRILHDIETVAAIAVIADQVLTRALVDARQHEAR